MSAPLEYARVKVERTGRAVVKEVSLSVSAGEILGLVGANGSGKTTLLRAGLGLIPLRAGEARLDGRSVDRWSERERAERAAWLSQDRRVGWNLPAREVAALGAPFAAPALARARADEALERVGLAAFGGRGVLDLSAGERARVLFARLLVARAPLIVADEPTAGVDIDGGLLMMHRLREEATAGAAVLVSLHDLALAAWTCDRVAVLAGGGLASIGPPLLALDPVVIERAFGVAARWIATDDGPLLSMRRASGGA